MTQTAAIGVDAGATSIKAAVVARTGEILLRAERPTESEAATKVILAVVETLSGQASNEDLDMKGIGVGAAGFVDARTGTVSFSPNMVYDDPHVAEALQARTGLHAVVDNDANAAAWGERSFGSAGGADELAFVTLGTGIGSGFVANGKLVRGATGAAAELGHTVIDPTGPQCPCGLRGCLEQFASGTAIARLAREALQKDHTSTILSFAGTLESVEAEHVSLAARQYDEIAREVLRRAGSALGVGLSNVVNIFDPQVIVLGGGVTQAGEPYLGPARDRLVSMLQAQNRRPTRLDVTTLGNDAGILGAAMLVFDEGSAQ